METKQSRFQQLVTKIKMWFSRVFYYKPKIKEILDNHRGNIRAKEKMSESIYRAVLLNNRLVDVEQERVRIKDKKIREELAEKVLKMVEKENEKNKKPPCSFCSDHKISVK